MIYEYHFWKEVSDFDGSEKVAIEWKFLCSNKNFTPKITHIELKLNWNSLRQSNIVVYLSNGIVIKYHTTKPILANARTKSNDHKIRFLQLNSPYRRCFARNLETHCTHGYFLKKFLQKSVSLLHSTNWTKSQNSRIFHAK